MGLHIVESYICATSAAPVFYSLFSNPLALQLTTKTIQLMDNSRKLPPRSTEAAALGALRSSRAKREAEEVVAGRDLSSLNKMLQWSTAHSAPISEPSLGREKAAQKTPEQLAADREWLDGAFPDMFADVNRLIVLLKDEENPLSVDETVEALEGLEEYFSDLNYAVNIDKLGALELLMGNVNSPHARVRAAAIWVLGSAMRDLEEVKELIMQRNGHQVLADRLDDEDCTVRAKAVMASSALLRHSKKEWRDQFAAVGGSMKLRRLLADENIQVRRRARFFLQHASQTGNEDFVKDLLSDRVSVANLSQSISELDVDDVADVEAAVGALTVLAETDRQGLLQVAPELPGVIDNLASRCNDQDLRDTLTNLASVLG